MEDMQIHEENMGDQAKTWLQENLRVIVSIFIVAAIALGIYSYSQRSQEANTDENTSTVSESTSPTGTPSVTTPGKSTSGSSVTTPGTAMTTPAPTRETETAFIETAVRGDGTTHLARRALMHYLEKTPDSSLSGEHKVYIEDYLRKQLRQKSGLKPNQSMEFSKDMIRQAIEKSKTLNDKQLQNLKKYSARVALYRS